MCILFKKSNCDYNTLTLDNKLLKRVNSKKFLGFYLDEASYYKEDVKHCMLSFNKQFFALYRKLNFLESENLLYLFKSYCLSFYSATNWYNTDNCKAEFRTLQTLYHKHITVII